MAFYSATLVGVEPLAVEIEIDLSSGLPFFQIVGLPDAILKESRTRVKSAIVQAGLDFPYDQRLVLNLAPSKIPKEGSGFELGLAARILASSRQIPCPEGHTLFLGELALDGTIKAVPELKALTYAARGMKYLVVPACTLDSLSEAPCPVVGVSHLNDLVKDKWWEQAVTPVGPSHLVSSTVTDDFDRLEFSSFWARHLEIAAVGRHHYLLCGPPGCGKTFFAESLKNLIEAVTHYVPPELPVLDALFSRPAGELPWAAPHHSATSVGLVGGGSPLKPGAITRAHGGILFLDELLEFPGAVLDTLREPVEKGIMEIYRACGQARFPSRFQLVGATNPCRCGNWKHPWKSCFCQKSSRQTYQARISGPFFDRFEVRVFCAPTLTPDENVTGRAIRRRVERALEFLSRTEGAVDTAVGGADRYRRGPGATGTVVHPKGGAGVAGYGILSKKMSLRNSKNVRKLVRTLAALEQKSQGAPYHWEEALRLQSLPELELIHLS